MQSSYGTLSVDGVGVALTFAGFLNPLLAAGIHVVSEFAFKSNSANLLNGSSVHDWVLLRVEDQLRPYGRLRSVSCWAIIKGKLR